MNDSSGACSTIQTLTDRWRVALASALLVWGVAVSVLADQSQSVAATGPTADAEVYLRRGEVFAGGREYDRAIADYDMAIQLRPAYAEAYNDRGYACFLKGNDRDHHAIADFTRAIELRPNYPTAYNNRGVLYMAGGYGRARAIADFDRALELKPDFRKARVNRANARLMRHPLLALDDFHRAGMYPERKVAMLGAAILLVVAGITVVRRTRIGSARRSV